MHFFFGKVRQNFEFESQMLILNPNFWIKVQFYTLKNSSFKRNCSFENEILSLKAKNRETDEFFV